MGCPASADAFAAGWLFIVNPLRPLHFCPECGRRYLAAHIESEHYALQS
jgi:hypothetical protein